VKFDRVGFRYRLDGPEILRGVDLQIEAGLVMSAIHAF
jgi:ABC-type bacteriocin/lantibiotic exporter with double-glycine peptidase domain